MQIVDKRRKRGYFHVTKEDIPIAVVTADALKYPKEIYVGSSLDDDNQTTSINTAIMERKIRKEQLHIRGNFSF